MNDYQAASTLPQSLGWSLPEASNVEQLGKPDPRELSRIDILRDLTPQQRQRVSYLGQEVVLPPDYILGTHGSHGSHLYLLLEGSVELSVPTPMDYLAVRIAMGGESVPLSVLLGEGKLITTAVTVESTRVMMIPRNDMLGLCRNRPEIGNVIFRAVSQILGDRYRATLARLTAAPEQAASYAELWANV